MATANSLESSRNITLERNKVITLTKRTVRFSKNVYQTHNIAGFGEGEVDIGTIHWIIILGVLIIGLMFDPFNNTVGWLLILAAIGGAIWNFAKPKHYGFLLTLNSGDKKLFTTTDKEGLKKVIAEIYDLIETEKEKTYQITVNNSKVSGSLIQGHVGGNVSYQSDE
ncbi:MAG: hypothetical protein Fur006_01370 [Coleofasciculaceae cyanobacterium]